MIDLIFAGDFAYLAGEPSIQEYSYDSRFGKVKSILNECDYSVVNLETPIITTAPTPIKKTGPNIYAHPKSAELLKYLGFCGVTLANNHFFDQGDNGVRTTINECKKLGIDYFGGGLSIEEAKRTRFIKVKNKQIAIINCCEKEFSIANSSHGGANPLDSIAQYYAITEAKKIADYVIVVTHGGIEHFHYPTLRMQETYRFFIDAGANVVINHHQHCFSGFEIYNSAPIFYGLGNFFFPRNKYSNSFWNIGYMVKLRLDAQVSFEIIPYNQCSGDINIIPLEGKSKDHVADEVDKINTVIASRLELEGVNFDFMHDTLSNYDWIFQPYRNKYFKALSYKGFIPKLLSTEKIDMVMALINCQSHFERFNFYLHSKTSKDI